MFIFICFILKFITYLYLFLQSLIEINNHVSSSSTLTIVTPFILYSLRPILTKPFVHFTHIKKKCIGEREKKIVLSVLSSIGAFFLIINAK
jgi:hypothetical protein